MLLILLVAAFTVEIDILLLIPTHVIAQVLFMTSVLGAIILGLGFLGGLLLLLLIQLFFLLLLLKEFLLLDK